MVYKLKKLLYRLKQSPSQWYKSFDSFIRGKRYTRSHYDPCVYYNKIPEGEYIYLLLYVDMFIAYKSIFAIDKLKKDLSSKFEIKDLSEAKNVLGMEIERDQKGDRVSLIQKGYLKKVLQKFNINAIEVCKYTMASHFKLKVLCLLLLLKSVRT